jgi:hypothetical protein
MNAVTKTEPAGEVQDFNAGLLSVIERAARDATIDVDKMERLFALQERVQERAAKQAFTEAKVAMRPALPEITMKGCIRIVKDGKTIQETPFARFEDIHEAVTPILTQHGFDLSFRNGLSPDGKVRVTTILSHVAGHQEETEFDLPHDSSGSKNSVQAVGSSTSYGKRYGTLSILNIKVSGEDDDASSAAVETMIEKPRDLPFPQGPAKNKTALQTACRAIWRDVEGVSDEDSLDIVLADGRDYLAQMQVALPSWWTGYTKDGEAFDGLEAVIARKRREFGGAR